MYEMSIECHQCHEEIPADEQDLLVCEECWSAVADKATTDLQLKLEAERRKTAKLQKVIDSIMPRYVELLEAAGINDVEKEPEVQLAKSAMGY